MATNTEPTSHPTVLTLPTLAPDPSLEHATMLVVDDEAPLRRTLEVSLSAHGFDVDVVGTGEHAVEAVRQSLPDLLVVDLGLPGISGVEVIEAVRSWNPIPIIVLSAFSLRSRRPRIAPSKLAKVGASSSGRGSVTQSSSCV